MENYSILLKKKDDGFIWYILENETNQVMKEYLFEEDATTKTDFLNSGGGFDGSTPDFFFLDIKSLK